MKSIRYASLLTLADQAVVSGGNFLTTAVLARMLTQESFGVFSLAWLSVIVIYGFQWVLILLPLIVNSGKLHHNRRQYFFFVTFTQQLLLAVGSVLLLLLGSVLLGKKYPDWDIAEFQYSFLVAVFMYLMQEYFRRYLYAIKKLELALASDVISYGGQIVLFILLKLTENLSIVNIFLAMAVSSGLACVVAFPVHILKIPLGKKFLYFWGRNWNFSKWLLPTAFLQSFRVNFFLAASGTILGPSAAGTFKALLNIVSGQNVLLRSTESMLLTSAHEKSNDQHTENHNSFLRHILIPASIMVFFSWTVILAPELWLKLFYKTKYSGYGNTLVILAGFYLSLLFLTITKQYYLLREETNIILVGEVVSALSSVCLGHYLIKKWGLSGAASGMLINCLIYLLLIVGFEFIKKRWTGVPKSPKL